MKQEVLMRFYEICSSALLNKEEYTSMNKWQLTQRLAEEIEVLKIILGKDPSHRCLDLLFHIGKTRKHFSKYPFIYLVLPFIKRDVKKGEPREEILEDILLLF